MRCPIKVYWLLFPNLFVYRLRRAGSELSLRSTSVTPLMKNAVQQKDAIHQTDHQVFQYLYKFANVCSII